jgi:hypothetical protein
MTARRVRPFRPANGGDGSKLKPSWAAVASANRLLVIESARKTRPPSASNIDGATVKTRKPPPPLQPVASVTPPGSSPRTTFVSRGTAYVSTVDSSRSIPIHRRPILCATAAAVPDPRNGSSTMSPGFEAIDSTRSMSASGLGVTKLGALGNNALISFFEVRLLPT